MNRFRTKRRVKDAGEGLARPSTDSDAPAVPIQAIKPMKSWGRTKKTAELEQKPELDLSTALPSSDDFRTSLLMSGLSARFSMLREQDDPSSKIGKASDDSVLFPSNRLSRLNDFGYLARGGLSDIAEVSSISGSIKPPFAIGRKDSYGTLDGYGTDDDSNVGGSIMSRAKPGEGNNLFGGRQKIYKISNGASASSKNLAEGGSNMSGRVLYDDDVAQSAFQKLREREREQERTQKLQEEQDLEEAEQAAQVSRPSSPPLSGYNRNRETSSTTSSGPNARMSTAATSITSQRTPSLSGGHNANTSAAPANGSLERSGTKTRRLYETGLDKDLHEQQFSAMNRIDTLARQRTLGAHTPPPGLASPTSATSFMSFDKFDRQPIAAQSSMPNLRAASPPPVSAVLPKFDFGIRPAVLEHKSIFGPTNHVLSPPLSPPMSEDDQRQLTVQPADIGKATASLAFSRPPHRYDDSKYSERQVQMQKGRETPPLRKHSPAQAFLPPPQSEPEPIVLRTRADSSLSFTSSAPSRSRSNSAVPKPLITPQYRSAALSAKQTTLPEEQTITSYGMFLAGSDVPPSPDEPELPPNKPWDRPGAQSPSIPKGYRPDPNQSPVLERPPESLHPAHRQNYLPAEEEDVVVLSSRIDQIMGTANANPSSAGNVVTPGPKILPPEDSPTLGPNTGLSGMVRQHLRSDSNNSSMYGGQSALPSAAFASRFPQDAMESMHVPDYSSTKSNPWDLDDWEQHHQGEDKENSSYGLQAATPTPLPVRSANNENPQEKPTWEQELASHHARMGSTETQIERQELADDLATRRKQVQEKMKSFVETDNSRSASPLPGMDWARQNNPLGILRSKTSRTSLSVKTIKEKEKEQTSKGMKKLGIGNATISSSTPFLTKKVYEDDAWKQEEEEMLRGVPKSRLGSEMKAFRQARRDVQRTKEQELAARRQAQGLPSQHQEPEWNGPKPIQTRLPPRQRTPSRERGPAPIQMGPRARGMSQERTFHHPQPGMRARAPSRERHPPPVSSNIQRLNGNSIDSHESESSARSGSGSRPPTRDRSSSDASGRSKSRNGRYRDDIAKAMAEGIGSSGASTYEGSPVSARLMPKSTGGPVLNFHPSPSMQPSPSFQSSSPFPASPVVPSPVPGSVGAARARGNSRSGYFDSSQSSYFDQNLASSQTNETPDLGMSPRPSPVAPFVVNPTPPINQPTPSFSASQIPTAASVQVGNRVPASRKKSINKSEISEPTFVSSTSRITTVNLPPGSSLANGSESSPPIPPINPRRRQTRVQTMFGAFGKKEDAIPSIGVSQAAQSTEEMSTFSADEADSGLKNRQKLRKSSSEGGNMSSRARQQTMAIPSPAMPSTPYRQTRSPSPPKVEGGMF